MNSDKTVGKSVSEKPTPTPLADIKELTHAKLQRMLDTAWGKGYSQAKQHFKEDFRKVREEAHKDGTRRQKKMDCDVNKDEQKRLLEMIESQRHLRIKLTHKDMGWNSALDAMLLIIQLKEK